MRFVAFIRFQVNFCKLVIDPIDEDNVENSAKNISEKDAELLFEHFSGMGQGMDFET